MLPQAKVDELYAKLDDLMNFQDAEPAIRDMLDDALHDAYGSGELDERQAMLRYLAARRLSRTDGPIGTVIATARIDTLIDAIALGQHTPPDPAHLARCQKLVTESTHPPGDRP